MKRILYILIGCIAVGLIIYACTKEIYSCGDINGDGIENELDCRGLDGKDGVDGIDGEDGKDGRDGRDGLIYGVIMEKEDSTVCDGYIMFFYADINGNGVVDTMDRLIGEIPVCNGTDGQDGTDGNDGSDGSDGIDGNDGADGSDGATPVFVLTNTDPSEKCPDGGVLVEIFINEVSTGNFEVCNGADGEDFVYNHSYEITNDPPECAEAGGRVIKIYNADEELVEQVVMCFGMTYGELKDLVVPLRKYFEDVSVIYKEITTCEHGDGYEVWVSIDDAEILHFFICPAAPPE